MPDRLAVGPLFSFRGVFAMPGDASASKIVVPRPDAGLSVQVPARPGTIYALDFDHLDAFFEQNGQNMQLSFPDGAMLTLQGFCNATASSDITLELRDGTQVSGADMVEVLGMSLQDFHTDGPLAAEAGGAAAAAPSGGPSAFSPDDAGYCGVSPSMPLAEQTPFAVREAEAAGGTMSASPVTSPFFPSGAHTPRLEDLLDASGPGSPQAEFLSALDRFSIASGGTDALSPVREAPLPDASSPPAGFSGMDMADENLDCLLALLRSGLL